MTKWVVNQGAPNERTIVADGHFQDGGYFHFTDENGQVATIAEKYVVSIDRAD